MVSTIWKKDIVQSIPQIMQNLVYGIQPTLNICIFPHRWYNIKEAFTVEGYSLNRYVLKKIHGYDSVLLFYCFIDFGGS